MSKIPYFLTPKYTSTAEYLYYLREKFKKSGMSQRKTTGNGSKNDISDSSCGAYCVLFFSQFLPIINHIFLFMTAITSPINAMREPIDRYKWL
jgi:hypothetical protein